MLQEGWSAGLPAHADRKGEAAAATRWRSGEGLLCLVTPRACQPTELWHDGGIRGFGCEARARALEAVFDIKGLAGAVVDEQRNGDTPTPLCSPRWPSAGEPKPGPVAAEVACRGCCTSCVPGRRDKERSDAVELLLRTPIPTLLPREFTGPRHAAANGDTQRIAADCAASSAGAAGGSGGVTATGKVTMEAGRPKQGCCCSTGGGGATRWGIP